MEWLRRWESWLTIASAVTAVLVVANMVLFEGNRALQMEVGRRAQYIQQTMQLENLHRDIVRAAAEIAVRNNDEELKAALARHGITFAAPPAAPTPP
ncbi:MAG: hypothetical protein HYR86_06445, partial [Candidatus Rokubacteria bacterium]|nr:hypothetical protein [Candidatus Rokubacteria bacterium]